MENTLAILIADDSQALFELCGVSLLERLLRILQRLEFRRAVVLSTAAEIVEAVGARKSSCPCRLGRIWTSHPPNGFGAGPV